MVERSDSTSHQQQLMGLPMEFLTGRWASRTWRAGAMLWCCGCAGLWNWEVGERLQHSGPLMGTTSISTDRMDPSGVHAIFLFPDRL